MLKIAIMISSRKGGHKFPAEAVANYLLSANQGVEVKIYNLLDYLPLANFLDKLGRWGDLKLPVIWRMGYLSLMKGDPIYNRIFRSFLVGVFANKDSERRIKKALGRVDIILSFQPEINCIGRWLKKWFGVPLHTMVMDYSSHLGWADREVDYYYVVNEIVYEQLKNYGVSEEKMEITGAPSQRGFEDVLEAPLQSLRNRLNINPERFTILLLAGYLGRMVDYEGIIKTIKDLPLPIQILVVVGRNYKLYKKLEAQNLPEVFIYYNVPSIHQIMGAADLVISKPGGMVIADALCLGKPLLLINPRAGSLQEIIFARHIQRQGAGIHLKTISELGDAIKNLMQNPLILREMSETAKKLGLRNRSAGRVIAQNIIRAIS